MKTEIEGEDIILSLEPNETFALHVLNAELYNAPVNRATRNLIVILPASVYADVRVDLQAAGFFRGGTLNDGNVRSIKPLRVTDSTELVPTDAERNAALMPQEQQALALMRSRYAHKTQ